MNFSLLVHILIYIDEQQGAYWDVSSMYLQGTEEYEMHLGAIKFKACQEYNFIWSGKAEGTADAASDATVEATSAAEADARRVQAQDDRVGAVGANPKRGWRRRCA